MPWDRLTLANWPSAIFRGQAHFLFDASYICIILGNVQIFISFMNAILFPKELR